MQGDTTIKRVLVTGGTRGIGEAIVRDFAAGGYEVVFSYRSEPALAEALAQELGDGGLKATAIHLDLNDAASLREAMARATAERGFDIVVHNAASHDDGAFYFMGEKQWETVIQASLNSFFYINKATLSWMIQQRWGRIITLASLSGEAGNRGQTNYAAAKGALIAATKSLAKEVARKGVLVNAVSPGLIKTRMTAELSIPDIKNLIPVGRMGRPDEVSKVVRFLASDDASYVNGAVIRVNGGLYT